MDSWESVVSTCEETHGKNLSACHNVLLTAYENNVKHPEVLWRLGRSYYEMAEESTDDSYRAPLLQKGLEVCKLAVEQKPDSAPTHKWLGILISAQKGSTQERVANAFIIREHFQKALELEPKDSLALHCMGNWCWKVMQVSWIERKAAALLFGEPPTSTYEECIKYLLASSAQEETVHNSLLTGDAYYQQKKYKEAKEWYSKAAELPATTGLQQRRSAEAKKKLLLF